MASYDVVIRGFALTAREQPAVVLQRILGLDAAQARLAAKRFPICARSGATLAEAEHLAVVLKQAGARVAVREALPAEPGTTAKPLPAHTPFAKSADSTAATEAKPADASSFGSTVLMGSGWEQSKAALPRAISDVHAEPLPELRKTLPDGSPSTEPTTASDEQVAVQNVAPLPCAAWEVTGVAPCEEPAPSPQRNGSAEALELGRAEGPPAGHAEALPVPLPAKAAKKVWASFVWNLEDGASLPAAEPTQRGPATPANGHWKRARTFATMWGARLSAPLANAVRRAEPAARTRVASPDSRAERHAPRPSLPRAPESVGRMMVRVSLVSMVALSAAAVWSHSRRKAQEPKSVEEQSALEEHAAPGELTIPYQGKVAPTHLVLVAAANSRDPRARNGFALRPNTQEGAVHVRFAGSFPDPPGLDWTRLGAYPGFLVGRELVIEPERNATEASVVQWANGNPVEIVTLRAKLMRVDPEPSEKREHLVVYPAQATLSFLLLGGETIEATFNGLLEMPR